MLSHFSLHIVNTAVFCIVNAGNTRCAHAHCFISDTRSQKSYWFLCPCMSVCVCTCVCTRACVVWCQVIFHRKKKKLQHFYEESSFIFRCNLLCSWLQFQSPFRSLISYSRASDHTVNQFILPSFCARPPFIPFGCLLAPTPESGRNRRWKLNLTIFSLICFMGRDVKWLATLMFRGFLWL